MRYKLPQSFCLAVLAMLSQPQGSAAQVPPSESERAAYTGLHAAALRGDSTGLARLLSEGANPNLRDSAGRTPVHVAAFFGHGTLFAALVRAGGDINALENRRYDAITIAAVRDDLATMKAAISAGGDAKLITSPYLGTALIAAAHLGHNEVVRELIRAGAPLDHVNNLGWTALIEAIVLGNGGARHTDCVRALLEAGANPGLADRDGVTPLRLARARNYAEMVELISAKGGK